jgi:hypothetical protein
VLRDVDAEPRKLLEPNKIARRPNEHHDTGKQQPAKHLQGLVVDRGNHGGPT